MRLRLLMAGVVLLAAAGETATAQTIEGTVSDQGGRPVAGVVVLLLDSAGVTVARGLSDERGWYRVLATAGGSFRIRTLRLGFRPLTSEPLIVARGVSATHDVALTGVPLSLDTIRVAGRNACRVRPDSAMATFAVWEQARTALVAAQLTAQEAAATRTLVYRRSLDPDDGRVVTQDLAIAAGVAARPWTALSPDSLHRAGYVQVSLDRAATFYVPDLDVLLSEPVR